MKLGAADPVHPTETQPPPQGTGDAQGAQQALAGWQERRFPARQDPVPGRAGLLLQIVRQETGDRGFDIEGRLEADAMTLDPALRDQPFGERRAGIEAHGTSLQPPRWPAGRGRWYVRCLPFHLARALSRAWLRSSLTGVA